MYTSGDELTACVFAYVRRRGASKIKEIGANKRAPQQTLTTRLSSVHRRLTISSLPRSRVAHSNSLHRESLLRADLPEWVCVNDATYLFIPNVLSLSSSLKRLLSNIGKLFHYSLQSFKYDVNAYVLGRCT